ncbi:unnamed protein product [Schistosoma mattheei]|uniref:Uncharacterized protein n=1 Tax=Schistosoma mattheei TaxID=31246 RepID=A0A183PM21_9TREM|nr:unnamed protein product [Schistosoma mattheei]
MQSLPVPRTLQSNLGTSNSDHHNKKCPKNPNISTQRNSYESANLHRIINNAANRQSVKRSLVTRSTSLCVAKKLASIQPSPAVYSSKSLISSPLKMGVPDNCFLFDGYKICVEENEPSSTTLISSATSFQTSKHKVRHPIVSVVQYRKLTGFSSFAPSFCKMAPDPQGCLVKLFYSLGCNDQWI